jgi:hypothetical protein
VSFGRSNFDDQPCPLPNFNALTLLQQWSAPFCILVGCAPYEPRDLVHKTMLIQGVNSILVHRRPGAGG